MLYTSYTRSIDLIREPRHAGWRLNRITGSHHMFKHHELAGIVVAPHPKKDLGSGLVAAIRQQAGI